jgi:uncharacterized protein (DUF488 family)
MEAGKKISGDAIYTIGHSNHAWPKFLDLLAQHHIALVVDTRGQPFSRFNPQFNRERLKESLAGSEIDYLWLGDRLSGRPRDPALMGRDGKPDWARVSSSPGFLQGIGQVASLAEKRVAVLCAEEDPRRCHRRFLLTPPLMGQGLSVLHIRGDGRIEREDDIRAQESVRSPQLDLFS